MELLIYVVPIFLLISSLMGTWFLSRMIIKLDDRNRPILQGITNSVKKTSEVSRKIDHVLLAGQKSMQHQQKMFEHERVLLASLNSQVEKLDIMMRVASQESQVSSSPHSSDPGSTKVKNDQNKQSDSSTNVSSIMKLDSKSLPKTEQGIALLEQLFNRRELSGKSEVIQRQKVNEDPRSKQLETPLDSSDSTAEIPRKPAFQVPQKDKPEQKPQAPHQQSNPRTILNLFASGNLQSSSPTEQERRRA